MKFTPRPRHYNHEIKLAILLLVVFVPTILATAIRDPFQAAMTAVILSSTMIDAVRAILAYRKWKKNRLEEGSDRFCPDTLFRITRSDGYYRVLYRAWDSNSLIRSEGKCSPLKWIVESTSDGKKYTVAKFDLIELSPLEQLATCAE